MAELLCMVFGVLCIFYCVAISAYTGFSSKFPLFWAAAGICLSAAGFVLHRGILLPNVVKVSILVLVGILAGVFLLTEALILHAMLQKPEKNLDYLIVLGAQVKGTHPSLSLQYRIDEAEAYLRENPDTKAVLSGGKGPGEEISEAACMYEALTKAGIADSRLLLEGKSTNTNENIKYSYALLQDAFQKRERIKIGIVTNDFHIYRGTALARKRMDCEIQGLPAKSNLFLEPNYLVREFFGVVKDKLAGNL